MHIQCDIIFRTAIIHTLRFFPSSSRCPPDTDDPSDKNYLRMYNIMCAYIGAYAYYVMCCTYIILL